MLPVYISVLLVSLSAVSTEIIFMRLTSISVWYHFAYMIISMALLGYGASGVFLTILRRHLSAKRGLWIPLIPLLLSLFIPLSFRLGQEIGFDPFLMMWDVREFFKLFSRYLLMTIPFFLAGSFTGLCVTLYSDKVGRIYLSDLIGAGLGGLAAIGLLWVFKPLSCLPVLSIAAFLGASVASIGFGAWKLPLIGAPVVAAVLGLMPPKLDVSQYKFLVAAERMPDAKVLCELSSPLALLTALRTPALRIAPGLSLSYRGDIPPQIAVFFDADSPTAITSPSDEENLKFLDHLTNALPYSFLEKPVVLVIGAGGGMDVLSALIHGARRVVALEINPQMVELVQERFADFSGGIYSDPRVEVLVEEARGFLRGTDERFDLIQLSLVESFRASAAGVYALSESYLYTVEAFEDYIDHLTENGVLCVTRWAKIPPVDTQKILKTICLAAQRRGIDPSLSVAVIKSWATETILLKRSPLTPREIESIKRFASERIYDLVYHPGIPLEEAARFEEFMCPELFKGADEGRFERWRWAERMFNIEPATDDKPYFFHFFRWRSVPYLVRTMGRNWLILIEWGYVMLVATLIQAVLGSLFLILLPLLISLRGVRSGAPPSEKLRTVAYFGGIGLGFMGVEIGLIQKSSLFLAHPIYSASTVIASMLFWAGLGSLCSARFEGRVRLVPFGAILILGVIAALLPFKNLPVGLPLPLKVVITSLLIAPLAFFMGMPLPMGVRRFSRFEGLVPWGWGINGCASVVGAVTAMAVALSLGHTALIGCSLAGYLLALMTTIGR